MHGNYTKDVSPHGKLALWQNWRSGKLAPAVQKLALWQNFLKNAHRFGVCY